MVLFYYRVGMKQMEPSTEKTAMSSSHPTRRAEPEHAHLDRCQMLPASHAEGMGRWDNDVGMQRAGTYFASYRR